MTNSTASLKNFSNSSIKDSNIFIRLLRSFFIILVSFYRAHISALMVGRCIYYPSCSQYAMTALKEAPLHIALWSILARILRCHPFAKGGWDPFVSDHKSGGHCCE